MFEIQKTSSFNKNRLTPIVGSKRYAYVTRTSLNNGILQYSGFVNDNNINSANTFSLGLLQMNFFFQRTPWYAGQFVRKIVPKFPINNLLANYFGTILNKQSSKLLSVLVREIDGVFNDIEVALPTNTNGEIAFDYMEAYIKELEIERIKELEAYLIATGLDDYVLTDDEEKVLADFRNNNIEFRDFAYKDLFDHIVQGRRLKKDDQIAGNLPFVMSGTTNSGIVGNIGNDTRIFPKNSLTIDIFGSVFYRNYRYGMGDDTGAYWNEKNELSKFTMLYIGTTIGKSLAGKHDYGHKLRSSRTLNFTIKLPVKSDKQPDYEFINHYICSIEKLVIKGVVEWKNKQIQEIKKVVFDKTND